jgi:hypothetical protein
MWFGACEIEVMQQRDHERRHRVMTDVAAIFFFLPRNLYLQRFYK